MSEILSQTEETIVPMPLPAAWVEAGEPAPRGQVALRGLAGGAATGTWECGPGRFAYTHATHETILVLEGDVTITTPDGRATTLGPGAFAHFPAGLTATWDVPERLRKAFFLQPA